MDEPKVPIARRGRTARFTRDDLLDAINRVGFLDFSLAEVARELGVTTSALYRVVPSREAAIELCLERIFSAPPVVRPQQGVVETVRQLSAGYWEIYCQYQGLSSMVLTFPFCPRIYLPALHDVSLTLSALGLDEATCLQILRHVPLLLAAHHVVFEHQTRDSQRATREGLSMLDCWAAPSDSNGSQPGSLQLSAVSTAFVMTFETAWEAIVLILKGLGIPVEQETVD